MKQIKFVAVLLLSLGMTLTTEAQKSGQITTKNSAWSGIHFYKDGQKIDKSEVRDLLSANPKAYDMLDRGLAQQSTSNIFSFVGGFLIGWPLGEALRGVDRPKWGFAAAGAGITVIGITFYSQGSTNIKGGLDLYNHSLTEYSKTVESYDISLVSCPNGLGLRITF